MTTCSTGKMSDGTVFTITRGPDRLIGSRDAGVRWCFGCRKHLPHTDELWGDSEPSYYDPVWIRKCSRCGKDRTEFPGTGW